MGFYLCMTPRKELSKAEKENKEKHPQGFLERRHTFTPMVYSADEIPGTEALAAHRKIASHLRFNLKRE